MPTGTFTVDAVLRRYPEDPAMTIRNILKDNWSLATGASADEVKFSTGWFDQKYKQPQITVSEISDDPEPWELGYGTIRVFAIYQVDCWVTVVKMGTAAKGVGIAKKYRWWMKTEVRRILKEQLTPGGDLKYIVLDQPGRNLDEPAGTPPRVRWSQDVLVVYEI